MEELDDWRRATDLEISSVSQLSVGDAQQSARILEFT